MNRGDVRQWANQATQLANDTQELRNQLQQAGVGGKDLSPSTRSSRRCARLATSATTRTWATCESLYSAAVDKFKELEFELRKRTDTTNEQLYLSGSEDLPPNFRALVDDTTGRSQEAGRKGGK